ncbi:MAG: NAD(P)-dependent glycerol-1-phosphate dehydrogenase [Thermoplasmata archaeon HGW-Thermoplasmata-1]|nr:MAG: NAD(P)-dependent glycerol-1-phosphate dehydrogenase [Thermoplasmata archaeon HGW-Thermoplasmata-1]
MEEIFDKWKVMVFPRNVLVGHDVTNRIAELCDQIHAGNDPLVIYDPITKKLAGDKITETLEKNGYAVDVINVTHGATMKEVKRVVDHAKKVGSEFFIGVGGGSIIDVAKLAAYKFGVSFVSVPTNAAHDGVASPRASIKEEVGSVSISANAPLSILADTAVISKAPYRSLASGCADAISNLTAVMDWDLARRLRNEEFSSFAAVLSKTAAMLILDNAEYIKPGIEESSWTVIKSLIVSGVAMSVAGSSRPASGAEHMISHMLDRLSPGTAMHGEQCGVSSMLTMYLHGGDWKMIRNALKLIGAPTTAKELGMPRAKFIEALVHAHELRPDRYTILGDKGLTKEAADRLLKATGVA